MKSTRFAAHLVEWVAEVVGVDLKFKVSRLGSWHGVLRELIVVWDMHVTP